MRYGLVKHVSIWIGVAHICTARVVMLRASPKYFVYATTMSNHLGLVPGTRAASFMGSLACNPQKPTSKNIVLQWLFPFSSGPSSMPAFPVLICFNIIVSSFKTTSKTWGWATIPAWISSTRTSSLASSSLTFHQVISNVTRHAASLPRVFQAPVLFSLNNAPNIPSETFWWERPCMGAWVHECSRLSHAQLQRRTNIDKKWVELQDTISVSQPNSFNSSDPRVPQVTPSKSKLWENASEAHAAHCASFWSGLR